MLRLIGLTIAILALALAIASGVIYATGPANDTTGPDGLAINGVFLALMMGLPAIVALVSLAGTLPLSVPRAWALAICAAILAADGAFAIAAFRLSRDWSQLILLYDGDEGVLSTRAIAWLHHLSQLGWCVLFAGLAELAVCAAMLLARGRYRNRAASA